jgi:hypothetical protein
MCDEHDHHHEPAAPGLFARLSRRQVLQGAVALAAVAGLTSARSAAAAGPLGARARSVDGLTARSLAMHLHASASEGVGSVRSHLGQALTNGFDVAWFTDHDWRRRRLLFRQTYSFIAGEQQFGGGWTVAKVAATGRLTTGSGGALVTSPVSPNDPATRKGSLRMRATSTGPAQATARHRINAEGSSRANFRGRIAGRSIVFDVLPSRAGVNAWGEVLLRLSFHPGSGTRPAGVLTLTYRLRTDVAARTGSTTGLAGFVDVPVTAGSWQTVTLDPLEDVRALWPDVQAEDNSLNEIEFHGASRRRSFAEYFFGYLRFPEQSGYDAIGVENALLAHYAGVVPAVLGLNGTEISLGNHVNQYGGPQEPFDYGSVTTLKDSDVGRRPDVVQHVHGLGGLVSINHPFKPGDGGSNITAEGVAIGLISTALDGADMLEVGYTNKGTNGTLAAHLAAWDAVSRNGLFVTGNGVSDDHSGQNWARQTNRFWTGAWTPELSEAALLDAFRAGRSYVGLLGAFSGAIDMAVDDAPMGSVLVGSASSRTLHVDVTDLPTGAAVQVLRGDVDYAGTGSAVPNTTVVHTLGAGDLATPLTVDTTDDCFVRLQVVDSAGAVIGFGQPTWALYSEPTTGVPAARLVTG